MSNYYGAIIALLIIALWMATIFISMTGDFSQPNYFVSVGLILWQTFLNTGLFITAHDGMHGIICSHHPKLNSAIARLSLLFYSVGGLSYDLLKKKHDLHHRFTGTNFDPDFHEHSPTFWRWYGQFMSKYISFYQLFNLCSFILIIVYLLKINYCNLLLFWALPLILSSLQLFFFGTFLPHRFHQGNCQSLSEIKSLYLPKLLSLITCYHFSYHQEHHQYPFIPWWLLPSCS